jgi:hypothetical protein
MLPGLIHPDPSGDQPRPLIEQLKRLRKGRGVDAPDLLSRIDPLLRRRCGIGPADSVTRARALLIDYLRQLVGALPADLAEVAAATLGMDTAATGRFLEARVGWLSDRLGREQRTVYRRMDEAFNLMAAAAEDIAANRSAMHGWYVELLEAVLRLDKDSPVSLEDRHIRVTAPQLTEIVNSTSIPGPPGEGPRLVTEMVFGGSLRPVQGGGGSTVSTYISLPAPLREGDTHHYRLQTRVPPGTEMAPHYVCVPLRRCQRFTVRVRFPLDRVPERVWRVEEVTPRSIDDRPAGRVPVRPNADAEVFQEFNDLRQGYGYGIQWAS